MTAPSNTDTDELPGVDDLLGSAFGSTARAGVIARQNGSGLEEATADRYMKEVLHVIAR
jgi:hypothetical protein